MKKINTSLKVLKIHYHASRFLSGVKLIFISLLLSSSSFSQTYTWGNVAIGGGGFVTGIITHKTSGDIYCRTDVGGAYRWDAANSKWIPLLDWNSDQETTYQGVEALAIDPQNANNVYMLAATSYWNGGKTAILKSTNKGNTFSTAVVTSQFTANGNGMGRSNGERLAVDPNNSNILFCGTRSNGLWKSTDGGATWSLAWNGVTTTANGNGICFVVFDPGTVSGGATQTIYIGISRTGSANIYRSTNGGSTFTAIQPTTSFMPHRAVLSADRSTLYVTMANAEGPWNCSTGRVYKMATATSTWTDITPNANGYSYGGVSVDPANANRVIVSTTTQWSNGQFGGSVYGDYVFLSANGGSSWTSKLTSTSTYNNNGIGWCNGQIHWGGTIEFDPLNTAKVWIGSGNGIFSCSDINAANTAWRFDVKGLEETVPQDAVSIPGGPFASVILDYDGFLHSDIYAYPATRHAPNMGHNTGIAFAYGNTSKMVRVGSSMYYSLNQGASWTACNLPGAGLDEGKVAISVDGSHILHSPDGSNNTYYSTNNGTSWTSTGLNVNSAFPVADKVNTLKFYVYDPSNGSFFRSDNEGQSFTNVGSPGTGGAKRIQTVPGYEGHIWIAMYGGGLKRSTNSGATFTSITNVTYCDAVGLGKAEPNATYPTIYIWGTIGGVKGVYRSIDQGANWTRINDDAHEWGGPANAQMVIGDWNVYGRVYISTAGRGIIVGDISTGLPVNVLSFDGVYNKSNRSIELKWKVTSESEMKGYKILRSIHPQENDWEEIAFVHSLNSGNVEMNYSYTDTDPSAGDEIYYKLVSLENNGNAFSGRIISVVTGKESLRLMIFPNPSTYAFNVRIEGEEDFYEVEVSDIAGKIIIKREVSSSEFSLGEELPAGMYFVSVKGSNQKKVGRVLKEII
jgi:hypothetical protein